MPDFSPSLRRLSVHLYVAVFAAMALTAAAPATDLARLWDARWITVTGAPDRAPGVYLFRRALKLSASPGHFIVHVSADNRYKLFVNGRLVTCGPARGDFFHWAYDSVDLAPFLAAGDNVIAALVWNLAENSPGAQLTYRTGFILQGDSAVEAPVNTNAAWRAICDTAITADVANPGIWNLVGAFERADLRKQPFGWETAHFDDRAWGPAKEIDQGVPRELFAPWHGGWNLIPRTIPLMELSPLRFASVREANGVPLLPPEFPGKARPVVIPAHTEATLLLDHGAMTTAYPLLTLSGGRDARLALTYAESLYAGPTAIRGVGTPKGNRADVAGKSLLGFHDELVADGGRGRTWSPLWWRAYRYVHIRVRTADEPLMLDDIAALFTAYPFGRRARFAASDPHLASLLDTGWRTARLCAHETYMDCPYYEQMQYVGDTRIQALVSYYNSGDARLARQAIEQIGWSLLPEGLTQSRYPSNDPQIIPPFSLWWIGMLHDYLLYVDEPAFVRGQLPGARRVAEFFFAHTKPDGTLGAIPWWNFTDWAAGWQAGVAPRLTSGGSAHLDLQWLLALQDLAGIEEAVGDSVQATRCRSAADRLAAAIHRQYWYAGRQLFADTPEQKSFSQQANSLAVLAGLVTGEGARSVMERVMADSTLTQSTIYFRYYTNRALVRAGLGDRYLDELKPWNDQLALGLTTWAEQPEPSRSDCHAWGASPNIELFRSVLGIDSAAPGFAVVRIEPHPGRLEKVAGVIPHPRGEISVALERIRSDGRAVWRIKVIVPQGVTGEFVWRGIPHPLTGPENNWEF